MAPAGLEHEISAIHAAPLYVFSQDLELRYTWMPRIPPELENWLPADVTGRTDEELFGEQVAAQLVALKQSVIASGLGAREDVEIAAPSGTFYYDITIEPVRGDDDEVVGITGVAFDVTRHHEIEAQLRRAQDRTAEAERVAHIGSWEWDVVHDELHWSPGLFQIYGIAPEQFDARVSTRQREQRLHPDDKGRLDEALATTLETAEPFEMDYRILRPDGRIRILHARCEAIVGAGGKVVRLVGTAQDVTEVRLAETALEDTAKELGRRASELQKLSQGDGREPLAETLGDRQLEILNLIAEGLSNLDIADRLFISEATVKWHVRQIFKKLGVANRAQAVARLLAED